MVLKNVGKKTHRILGRLVIMSDSGEIYQSIQCPGDPLYVAISPSGRIATTSPNCLFVFDFDDQFDDVVFDKVSH